MPPAPTALTANSTPDDQAPGRSAMSAAVAGAVGVGVGRKRLRRLRRERRSRSMCWRTRTATAAGRAPASGRQSSHSAPTDISTIIADAAAVSLAGFRGRRLAPSRSPSACRWQQTRSTTTWRPYIANARHGVTTTSGDIIDDDHRERHHRRHLGGRVAGRRRQPGRWRGDQRRGCRGDQRHPRQGQRLRLAEQPHQRCRRHASRTEDTSAHRANDHRRRGQSASASAGGGGAGVVDRRGRGPKLHRLQR